MLRWFAKLLFLALLGFGFFHIAFREAPDLTIAPAPSELLAANMPGSAGQPEIRVLVAEALPSATLTVNGSISMLATKLDMKTAGGTFSQSVAVEVRPTGRGIQLGVNEYVRVRMKSLDNQPLRLTWRQDNADVTIAVPYEIEIYGTHVMDAQKRKIPRVRVLARMKIEEYLYGVLAGEVPSNWPLEALRAQAVASRTFAYFEVKSRQNQEYDVHASTRSQVWRPSMAVEAQFKRAVDTTAGIVLTERNMLIKTFFHSECGGYTADARWVFTKTPILALSGVRCPRCSDRANKPSSWSVTYTRQEIVNRLRRAGLLRQGSEIRMIQGLDQDGNPMGRRLGRVVTVELTLAGARSGAARIPANEFRMAMGADRKNLASTYMVLEGGDDTRVTFSGLGWGHGVGLCQYGAAYSADKLGYGFLDILALYYPGSKPVRLWGLNR